MGSYNYEQWAVQSVAQSATFNKYENYLKKLSDALAGVTLQNDADKIEIIGLDGNTDILYEIFAFGAFAGGGAGTDFTLRLEVNGDTTQNNYATIYHLAKEVGPGDATGFTSNNLIGGVAGVSETNQFAFHAFLTGKTGSHNTRNFRTFWGLFSERDSDGADKLLVKKLNCIWANNTDNLTSIRLALYTQPSGGSLYNNIKAGTSLYVLKPLNR